MFWGLKLWECSSSEREFIAVHLNRTGVDALIQGLDERGQWQIFKGHTCAPVLLALQWGTNETMNNANWSHQCFLPAWDAPSFVFERPLLSLLCRKPVWSSYLEW